jgi:hypothetical protein
MRILLLACVAFQDLQEQPARDPRILDGGIALEGPAMHIEK